MTTNGALRRPPTATASFGSGRRESHDSSAFYARGLAPAAFSSDTTVTEVPEAVRNQIFGHSSEQMAELPDNSVALVVTSPPYHAGKDYDTDQPLEEYLAMLHRVLGEVHRVLEPGGRVVINVANLGRRPYLPLSALATSMAVNVGFFPPRGGLASEIAVLFSDSSTHILPEASHWPQHDQPDAVATLLHDILGTAGSTSGSSEDAIPGVSGRDPQGLSAGATESREA